MGVSFDYFSAASDEEASLVIDRVGGPGSQAKVTPLVEPKRGIFGRVRKPKAPTSGKDTELTIFDTVSGNGIDPVVQMGTLEELLTGRSFHDITFDPRSGHLVADRDGGELLVVTLTDALSTALASASDEDLEQAAVPWSETEEFWDAVDPAVLAGFLKDLAGLARRAEASGQGLYCWVCV